MRRVCLYLLLLPAVLAAQPKHPDYSESLRFSCFDTPFLSVSASVPGHKTFPEVDLSLVDPSGREVGPGKYDRSIPRSHYGKVVMPKHPEMSKEVAAEICHATPGRYVLTVWERSRTGYYLSIMGDDGTSSNTGNESLDLYFQPEENHSCRYRFSFSIDTGKTTIRWLDRDNHPLSLFTRPNCEPIVRAAFVRNPRIRLVNNFP